MRRARNVAIMERKNSSDPAVREYLDLRKDVDALVDKVSRHWGTHITCHKGCDTCCLTFSVFPVEFHAIKEEMERKNITIDRRDRGSDFCPLLAYNGVCRIYEMRPIICRTHGLPIVFTTDEDEDWKLSYCHKNLIHAWGNERVFDELNTINIDEVNARLVRCNIAYTNSHSEYAPDERISLSELLET